MWKIFIFSFVIGRAFAELGAVIDDQPPQINFCKETLSCYEIAAQQLANCENVQSMGVGNKTTKKPENSTCKTELNDMRKEKNSLERLRVKQFRSCLNEISGDGGNVPKLSDEQKLKCSKRNKTSELVDFSNFDLPANKTPSAQKQFQKVKHEQHKLCMAHYKEMENQCTFVRNCCILSKICDEMYETNESYDTHLKVHQQTLKILRAERQCVVTNEKKSG